MRIYPAPRLSLIVAASRNNVIGRDGALPWHIPEDLARFKAVTMGHPIIMGRVTYQAIGRTLPGRTSIVLTRRKDPGAVPGCLRPTCLTVHSPEQALRAARSIESTGELFVIGGEQIFRRFLPSAHRIYMTRIHEDVDGDAAFPELGPEWVETFREDHATGESQPYSFIVYDRR